MEQNNQQNNLKNTFPVHRNAVPEDKSVDAGDDKEDTPEDQITQVLGVDYIEYKLNITN